MMSIARESAPSASAAAMSSWRDFSSPPMPRTMESSLGEFVRSGFHGTTIRALAEAAGMSVPGLYHHYRSKNEILEAVMAFAQDDLYWRSLEALRESDGSTLDRMDRLIECLVLFHAHRPGLAFIASSEIRGLLPEARAKHIAARDKQQHLLDEIVQQGVAEGVFACDQPHLVGLTIITMCTGVAQWYRPGGPLDPEEIADQYVGIARRVVEARVP